MGASVIIPYPTVWMKGRHQPYGDTSVSLCPHLGRPVPSLLAASSAAHGHQEPALSQLPSYLPQAAAGLSFSTSSFSFSEQLLFHPPPPRQVCLSIAALSSLKNSSWSPARRRKAAAAPSRALAVAPLFVHSFPCSVHSCLCST